MNFVAPFERSGSCASPAKLAEPSPPVSNEVMRPEGSADSPSLVSRTAASGRVEFVSGW